MRPWVAFCPVMDPSTPLDRNEARSSAMLYRSAENPLCGLGWRSVRWWFAYRDSLSCRWSVVARALRSGL